MHDESTAFIHGERPGRSQASTTDAPGGLEWQSFSARRFPGRRRHDLEALTAYGAYRRRSQPQPRPASGEAAEADRPAQAQDVVRR